MRIKTTPIVYSQDRATNQNNINTSNNFGQLAKNPQLSANSLTGISLKAGKNTIPHKLNRKLSGWTLIGKNGAGDIYQTTGSQPELFLYLTSTTDVIVDLSVF
jgi:hypothetical protein